MCSKFNVTAAANSTVAKSNGPVAVNGIIHARPGERLRQGFLAPGRYQRTARRN